MAGLKDTIQLDIDAALASIGRLDNALDQAARTFGVELTRSMDVLRTIPPVDVDVVVDGSRAQAAIDAAVSDTSALVDVDVQGTDELRAADDAAEDLGDEIERTGKEAERAEGQFKKTGDSLKKAFAVVGVAGALAGIRSAVDAASDLEESQSKANVVFGASVGLVDEFAKESATAVGLSKQAALGFTGTFGNLFVALGVSQTAAADLSTEIVLLGADLASFNNLEVDETLEKLRSGLVGEVEPLRALGINFNAAQVEAKAFALGLVAVGEEASEAAKLQARYALIVEQTGTAQGDFARTSGGLANQQRILVAEFQNAAAVIGAALLPTILDLVQTARDDLVPAIIDLATSAVPAFVGAMQAGVPIFLSTLDVLVALTPIIEVLGNVVSSLPEPLVTAVATFGLLGSGLGPLPSLFGAVSKAATAAGGGIGGLSAGFGALLGPIGLVTIALGAGLAIFSAHQKAQEEDRKAVEAATTAFLDQSVAIDARTEALTRSRVESENQTDDLRRLGVEVEDFDGIARRGGSSIENFIDRASRMGEVGFFRDDIDSAAEGIEFYGSAAEFARRGLTGNDGLIQSLTELNLEYRKGAKAAIEAKIASGDLTFAQAMEAVERNRAKNGTIDYITVQRELEEELVAVTDAQDRANAAARTNAEGQVEFTGRVQEAATFLADAASKVDALTRAQIDAIDPTGVLTERFRTAEGSAADYAVMAEATGLSLEQLTGIQNGVSEETQEFVDTVIGGMQGLQAAIGELKEDDSLDSFVDNFKQKVADTALFITNIDELVRRGADDLAATLLAKGENAATAAAEAVALGDTQLAIREGQLEEAERQEAENVAAIARLGTELVSSHDNTRRDLEDLPPPDLTGPYSLEAGRLRTLVDELAPQLFPAAMAGGAQVGANFISGFGAGITSNIFRLEAPANQAGAAIIRFSNTAIGAASPSKEAMKIGRFFVEGLALGLEDTARAEIAAVALADAVMASAAIVPGPVVVPAFTAASVAPPPVVVGASAGAGTGFGAGGGVVVNGPLFDGVTIERGQDPLHVFAEARQQLVEVSVPSA